MDISVEKIFGSCAVYFKCALMMYGKEKIKLRYTVEVS